MDSIDQKPIWKSPDFVIGVGLALLIWGVQLIGVTVNLWFGAAVLAIAFALMARAFWVWEGSSRWHVAYRIGTVLVVALLYISAVGWQIRTEWLKEHMQAIEQPRSVQATASELKPSASEALAPDIAKTKPAKIPMLAKSAVAQNTSNGGINIDQHTEGDQSPIVNSPITVGNIPRRISPTDAVAIQRILTDAKVKHSLKIMVDTNSNAVDFANDFCGALKASGWEVIDGGVNNAMIFQPPGKKLRGVLVNVKGTPISEKERFEPTEDNPLFYLAEVFAILKVTATLHRDETYPDGFLSLEFLGFE